ncbi:MAG: helix-turn-helix transcriptional regulator [Muribaculaceae bacterium]|nr:helix-turn-helix transcriptional regulator [Muribaculaceae bacterium]
MEGITYQLIVLVDCKSETIVHYSDKFYKIFQKFPKDMRGYNAYDFFREFITEQDLMSVRMMLKSGIEFIRRNNLNPEDFVFRYLTSFKNAGFHSLVHHNSSLITDEEDPGHLYIMTSMSFASNFEMFSPILMSDIDTRCFEFNAACCHWASCEIPFLSLMERNVLILSTQGLTAKEIAAFINKSDETVKTYKRTIFEKLRATNISQAVATAQNFNLI